MDSNAIDTAAAAQDAREQNRFADGATLSSGSVHTVRARDTLSGILGTSDPQALGNAMQANGMRNSNLAVGQNVFVPADSTLYGDQTALGQGTLNADNVRLQAIADARAQAAAATASTNLPAAPLSGLSFNDVAALGSSYTTSPSNQMVITKIEGGGAPVAQPDTFLSDVAQLAGLPMQGYRMLRAGADQLLPPSQSGVLHGGGGQLVDLLTLLPGLEEAAPAAIAARTGAPFDDLAALGNTGHDAFNVLGAASVRGNERAIIGHETESLWWENARDTPVSLAEAKAIAEDNGAYFPDFMRFAVLPDVEYELRFGKTTFANYLDTDTPQVFDRMSLKPTSGAKYSLLDSDGNFVVYVKSQVLTSDRAITAIFNHEGFEAQETFDSIVRSGGSISMPTLRTMLDGTNPSSLHGLAVQQSDDLIREMIAIGR